MVQLPCLAASFDQVLRFQWLRRFWRIYQSSLFILVLLFFLRGHSGEFKTQELTHHHCPTQREIWPIDKLCPPLVEMCK